ncbi:hypothetical protein EG68_05506 [Paragonimus skrjabini miyazakii]|uniref:Uncharacterized protein n=1 Tax=Paragonimus skrjabini miyazakii TaxID=59628 RepID=A0A8S9YXC9_9TREM|nr:hypothetical protein EG68_05506 [Paragonimus skrjabini miyazakii]
MQCPFFFAVSLGGILTFVVYDSAELKFCAGLGLALINGTVLFPSTVTCWISPAFVERPLQQLTMNTLAENVQVITHCDTGLVLQVRQTKYPV